MPGDENNGNLHLVPGQCLLQIKTTEAREPDIEHQAAGGSWTLAGQKLLRRSKGLDIEPHRAEEIAQTAEFFSFGTNDLTQTTFGISRDDAASFLGTYTARGILPIDPFVSIDRDGVGELIRIGVERGRKARPDLKVGICGEHGGDPASVAFCHEVNLDYVSCSPFRTPIARLAAAQAALGKAPASQA